VYLGVALNYVAFLEISRNRLAALKVRQATHASRTHFWVFFHALPRARCFSSGDTNWLAQFSWVFGVLVMLGHLVLVSTMCVGLVCCVIIYNFLIGGRLYEPIYEFGI